MKSDYKGGPLPPPSASNTMRLESLVSFSMPDWSFLEGSAGGNMLTKENLVTWHCSYTNRAGRDHIFYFFFFKFHFFSDLELNYYKRNPQDFPFHCVHFYLESCPILAKIKVMGGYRRGWALAVTFIEHLLYTRHNIRKFTYTVLKFKQSGKKVLISIHYRGRKWLLRDI